MTQDGLLQGIDPNAQVVSDTNAVLGFQGRDTEISLAALSPRLQAHIGVVGAHVDSNSGRRAAEQMAGLIREGLAVNGITVTSPLDRVTPNVKAKAILASAGFTTPVRPIALTEAQQSKIEPIGKWTQAALARSNERSERSFS